MSPGNHISTYCFFDLSMSNIHRMTERKPSILREQAQEFFYIAELAEWYSVCKHFPGKYPALHEATERFLSTFETDKLDQSMAELAFRHGHSRADLIIAISTDYKLILNKFNDLDARYAEARFKNSFPPDTL